MRLKVSWAISRNRFSGGWTGGADYAKVNNFGDLFFQFLVTVSVHFAIR